MQPLTMNLTFASSSVHLACVNPPRAFSSPARALPGPSREGDGPVSFDTLSGLAPLLRVKPEVQSSSRFGAHWKCDHEAEGNGSARFHIVTSGACVIELQQPTRS